tara:strand:+ start:319 stop:1602 length:1284 start_codon:yes stop_codon:yes gene_type:complete
MQNHSAPQTLKLLSQRNFLPLFLTQFFGAFNDNAFKLSMLTLISYFISRSQAQSEMYQAIASGLFVLPFFIFSATAGQLADKIDKAKMARWLKIFELFLMFIGGYALFSSRIYLMFFVLTGMGVHSTFFGPIKYAILPQHLPRNNLLGATSLIEGSTFLAILFGTVLGTLCVGGQGGGVLYAIVLIIAASIFGLLASFFIPKASGHGFLVAVDWRVDRATFQMVKDITKNKKMIPVLMAISWFWFIGVVVLTKMPDYVNFILNADSTIFAIFLALFSIGIAMGSYSVNFFLKGKVSLKMVPWAMFILSIFLCDLFWATPNSGINTFSIATFFHSVAHIRISLDFFCLACCGGLYIVPLYTFLQAESFDTHRARTIAANNIFNALFMVLGSFFVMLLLAYHIDIPTVFLILGIINVFVSAGFWVWFKK